MIALIQRTSRASVTVEDKVIAEISQGLLVLLGVEKKDSEPVIGKMADKILKYRVFADSDGKMNRSVMDIQGSVLMVPQFTLAADTDKGLRPSFSNAAPPEKGLAMFNQLIDIMRVKGGSMVDNPDRDWLQTGQFGADMAVELINDGPVTFTLTI